jgi:hypothetical protein
VAEQFGAWDLHSGKSVHKFWASYLTLNLGEGLCWALTSLSGEARVANPKGEEQVFRRD